jgi:hypothetical protein
MRTRIITSAAVVGLALTALSSPAHAATTTGTATATTVAATGSTSSAQDSGGWMPITETDREYPAGTVCSFGLRDDVVSQAEEYRVARTYPDGTPLETDYRGPLVVRYTNESTGASVERDLSGTAQLYTTQDHSSLWVSQDHFGLTVQTGDPYHAAGLFVLTGPSVFIVPADHDVTVLTQTQVENICDTLG